MKPTGEARKASIVARVWGWLYTALPAQARVRARRSHGFRPNLRGGPSGKFLDLEQFQDAD